MNLQKILSPEAGDDRLRIPDDVGQKVLAERGLRLEIRKRNPRFRFEDFCFDKQIWVRNHPAKRKTVCTSGRSGKTVYAVADIIDDALGNPGKNYLYLARKRINAKRIVWKYFKQLNRDFNLGIHFNNQELTLTFPNDVNVFIAGANDESSLDDFRGIPMKKVFIDEGQAYPDWIEYLIFDVLTPRLFDWDGDLVWMGTPHPRCAGAFYNAVHQKEGFANWPTFHWTMLDNPHLGKETGKSAKQLIDEELERRGLTIDHPTVQRELFGIWREDKSSIVYQFDERKNVFRDLPEGPRWEYVLGIDIGYDPDPDAAAIWAFSEDTPKAYLLKTWQWEKQTVEQLAKAIRAIDDDYKPVKSVIDTGGLGKKIAEEINDRFGLNLVAAEKKEKWATIELMNSDFQNENIYIHEDDPIIEDLKLLPKDMNADPDRPREDPRFANHRSDATLYSWREVRHFLYEPVITMEKNPDEKMEEFWEKEAEVMQRKHDIGGGWLADLEMEMEDAF